MFLITIQEVKERSIHESLAMIGIVLDRKDWKKLYTHRNTLEVIDLLNQWAKEFVGKFPDLHPGEEWFYQIETFVMQKVDSVC